MDGMFQIAILSNGIRFVIADNRLFDCCLYISQGLWNRILTDIEVKPVQLNGLLLLFLPIFRPSLSKTCHRLVFIQSAK